MYCILVPIYIPLCIPVFKVDAKLLPLAYLLLRTAARTLATNTAPPPAHEYGPMTSPGKYKIWARAADQIGASEYISCMHTRRWASKYQEGATTQTTTPGIPA